MIHSEVLPDQQADVLSKIGGLSSGKGFYLAGGTAVALHLGHRRSIDLDWFIDKELPMATQFASEIAELASNVELGKTERSAIYINVSGVRTCYLRYKYQMIGPLEPAAEFRCNLAGLADLAAMKLAALAQRGLKRDFIDIYAIAQAGMPLGEMISNYRRKFKVEDDIPVLRALTYFEDAELDEMPEMLQEVQWKTVRDTILRWAKGLR